eukprot:Lithocolla_globosa_v1_NODE_224_length_5048_cov_4.479976.p3 type:complete len:263 gc:universal NODE_224_length_5048_cov_4.479976:3225-4013(+)
MNQNIFPSICRILIHNNHCYKLNKSVNKLKSKTIEVEWDEVQTLKASNTFKFKQFNLEDKEVHFVKSLNEITQRITETDKSNIVFLVDSYLNQILFDMVHENAYIPDVSFSCGRILSISFKIDDKMITIMKSEITEEDEAIHELDEIDYMRFYEADQKFYQKIMKPEYMSEFNAEDSKIEQYYETVRCAGHVTQKNYNRVFNAIDINKAYSSCVKQITKIPVFGYFDRYTKYDGSDILPHSNILLKQLLRIKASVLYSIINI